MTRPNVVLVISLLSASCGFRIHAQQDVPQPAANSDDRPGQADFSAQHEPHPRAADAQQNMPAGHEGMHMQGMNMSMNKAGMFLMDQASGTGINPASSQVPMWMRQAGSWDLMFHTSIFLNDIQQAGPRGVDKFFSTNWFMGMAARRIGMGSFMGRAMVSLDPLTVTKRRYPELFQTGETAFGKPIIDAQHPHDLLMEFGL